MYNFTQINLRNSSHENSIAENHKYRADHILFELVGVFGMSVNILLLVALLKNKMILGRIPHLFVCNQSLIDLLVCIFAIVFENYSYIITDKIPEHLASPEIICKFLWSTYPQWALLSSSSCNLVLLTIQRYLSICHSTWHHRYMSRHVVVAFLVFSWVSGFIEQLFLTRFTYFHDDGTCVYVHAPAAMEIFEGISANMFYPGICDVSHVLMCTLGTVTFIWMLVWPLLTMIFCNGRIITFLLKKTSVVPCQEPVMSIKSVAAMVIPSASSARLEEQAQTVEKKRQRQRAMFYTFSAMCIVYILCYSPYQITWLYFMLGGTIYPRGIWVSFSVGMALANCCVNPLIYFVRMKSMRRELMCSRDGDSSVGAVNDL